MTKILHAWAALNKVEDNGDGTCTVFGLLTDSGLDRDKQKMNQAWLDKAVPQWYNEGANIREMHPHGTTAAGVGIALERADNGGWFLLSKVVDPIAVKKCLSNPPVYTGYSIGIRDYSLDMTKADAPNGEVVSGYICEASLADRPSNPRTVFSMVKTEGDEQVWVGEDQELDEPDEDELPAEQPEGDGTVTKYVSAAQRKQYAKQGVAMKNGDFPIPDKGHLKAAVGRLKNYTGDKAAARRHILKRARALGVTLNLGKADNPDRELVEQLRLVNKATTLDKLSAFAGSAAVLSVHELRKYDEAADIAGAQDAIAAIARLIQSEAGELANGRLEELRDIGILLEAGRSLEYFICREQMQAEVPDPQQQNQENEAVSPGAALFYSQEAELSKTEEEPVGTEPDAPAEQEPAVQTLTKDDMAAMIKSAVTEAVEPIKSELDLAKADLAKVLQQPQGGGPAQTRTSHQTSAARTNEADTIRTQISEYLSKADAIGNSDSLLAQGYRDQADTLERRLARTQ